MILAKYSINYPNIFLSNFFSNPPVSSCLLRNHPPQPKTKKKIGRRKITILGYFLLQIMKFDA